MLTQCPHCRTVFRVTAAQIRIRDGRVRCGQCKGAFSALQVLLDEKVLDTLVASGTAAAGDATPERPAAQSDTVSASSAAAMDEAAVRAGLRALPADIGLLFDEEPVESQRRRRTSGRLWAVLSGIALVALAGQVVWFQQLWLFDEMPAARPWLAKVCAYAGCELAQRRAVQAFKLAARDVREHPRYADTLLVNATLVNNADFKQAFPRLQLSLFDETGTMIGARRFEPTEYLDESLHIDAGISPAVPVFIVLEIAGPTDEAVSFEFTFL